MTVVLDYDPVTIRELGRQFGYPECCIDAFIADLEAGRPPALTRAEQHGWTPEGIGYVPCPAHVKVRQGCAGGNPTPPSTGAPLLGSHV